MSVAIFIIILLGFALVMLIFELIILGILGLIAEKRLPKLPQQLLTDAEFLLEFGFFPTRKSLAKAMVSLVVKDKGQEDKTPCPRVSYIFNDV